MTELGKAAQEATIALRRMAAVLWATGLSTEERVLVNGRVMVRAKQLGNLRWTCGTWR